MSTPPNVQAWIDQGAAEMREHASNHDVDLTDPQVATAIRLVLIDVHEALKNPAAGFAVSAVTDFWLNALVEAAT